ncbi:hypothetical protein PAPHI01_1200 [Pancytospora philotis]|nr:hypothetical protein PAPHI01_1200 [Pancytospora philotis]
MDFPFLTGHKKTSDALLGKIKGISASPAQLLENLKSLRIFQAVTPTGSARSLGKLLLDEAPNSVKMSVNSSGKRSVSMAFPNIFGGGEFVNVSYDGPRSCGVVAGLPGFLGRKLCQYKLSASSRSKEYNDRKVAVHNAHLSLSAKGRAVSLGAERISKLTVLYAGSDYAMCGAQLSSKGGFSLNSTKDKYVPFLKLVLQRPFGVACGRFFADGSLSLGRLFGQTNLTEKFFLGADVRGYRPMSITPVSHNKKIGGNSFAALRTQAGALMGPFRVFAFADAAVVSTQGLAQCYEIVAGHADTNCMGRSVGVGVSLRDKRGVSLVYSAPLTSNPEVEKYSVGLDFSF